MWPSGNEASPETHKQQEDKVQDIGKSQFLDANIFLYIKSSQSHFIVNSKLN